MAGATDMTEGAMATSLTNAVPKRLAVWLAALVGAVVCVLAPLLFAQQQNGLWPLPGLYFVQIALVGVLVLLFVAAGWGLKAGRRWLPWAAAGILLAFVILGGFSIGPFLLPAFAAFALLGILVDWPDDGAMARHAGVLLVAAVAQAALMLLATLIA